MPLRMLQADILLNTCFWDWIGPIGGSSPFGWGWRVYCLSQRGGGVALMSPTSDAFQTVGWDFELCLCRLMTSFQTVKKAQCVRLLSTEAGFILLLGGLIVQFFYLLCYFSSAIWRLETVRVQWPKFKPTIELCGLCLRSRIKEACLNISIVILVLSNMFSYGNERSLIDFFIYFWACSVWYLCADTFLCVMLCWLKSTWTVQKSSCTNKSSKVLLVGDFSIEG